MEFVSSAFARKMWRLGWTSQRQSPFCQCNLLDFTDRRSMARPSTGIWWLENTHRRFCRWRDKGTWEHVLANPMDMPDFEWLMIDSTYCKVHAHTAGAKDGNQDMRRTKGGSTLKYIWPWMRMVCRSESLLQRVPVLISVRLSHSFKYRCPVRSCG